MEASGRGQAVVDPLLRWRYGPAGFGLCAYEEFGLGELMIDDLRDWSARWFTRGNAVLWIAGGPPPEGLRLDLPDGPRRESPVTPVVPRTPAYFTGDIYGVGFDAVVPRSAAAAVYTGVLDRRLTAVLRRDLGLSYTIAGSYEVRDRSHAMVTAFADTLPDRRHEITGPFVDVLVDLAPGAYTEEDLRAVRGGAVERLRQPTAALSILQSTATDILTGADVRSTTEVLNHMGAVTAEDVSAVGRAALDTGLAMVPAGQAVGRAGFTQAPGYSSGTVEGEAFVLAGRRKGDGQRLVVGAGGVSIVDGPRIRTVHFDECGALLVYPDGGRMLIGADAIVVPVEPTLWAVPPDVLARIDAAVAADRVARLPPRRPEVIPDPAQVPDEAPPPTLSSVGRRARWINLIGAGILVASGPIILWRGIAEADLPALALGPVALAIAVGLIIHNRWPT